MNHMSDGPFERRVKVSHFELANPVKGFTLRLNSNHQDIAGSRKHQAAPPRAADARRKPDHGPTAPTSSPPQPPRRTFSLSGSTPDHAPRTPISASCQRESGAGSSGSPCANRHGPPRASRVGRGPPTCCRTPVAQPLLVTRLVRAGGRPSACRRLRHYGWVAGSISSGSR
jgi:hypothetical protein